MKRPKPKELGLHESDYIIHLNVYIDQLEAVLKRIARFSDTHSTHWVKQLADKAFTGEGLDFLRDDKGFFPDGSGD